MSIIPAAVTIGIIGEAIHRDEALVYGIADSGDRHNVARLERHGSNRSGASASIVRCCLEERAPP